MTKEELINQIDSYIKENHTGDITGAVLNRILHNIVDFSENPSKASGQKLGLVVHRALPIRPVPGMTYYTGMIKIKRSTLSAIGGSVSTSSFVPNIEPATFGFKNNKIIKVHSTVPSTISASDFTDPLLTIIAFQLKGGPKMLRVKNTYDRSRPITWSDLEILIFGNALDIPVLSPNFRLYRPVYHPTIAYDFQVTRPCIYLPPIKGIEAPIQLTDIILREPTNKRLLHTRVYYWRPRVHYRIKDTGTGMKLKSGYTENKHRLLCTRYINGEWGIKHEYGKRVDRRSPRYGGRIVIYKRLRNKLYKYMELTFRTGTVSL